ncbi:hypothetical protein LSM04_008821 [Trypanosoma melophagium]|uniref:uncharacterized protein n=1 Tax=Trypanosoma melophagium TaxID=715481 RepID=UPI00351AA43E|nr:hypothetical protein LSM04_008821 [Trypanosoma melophagium]
MLRYTPILAQLQRQYMAHSIGYSAAFAEPSERPVSAYQMVTALYSPASTNISRRKGHAERQKRYAAKVRLALGANRYQLGMKDGI